MSAPCANTGSSPTRRCARAGVRDRIGEDVQGIGFALRSGIRIDRYVATRVHASHFSHSATGQALAELLLRRIDGADPRDCQRLARTTLISSGEASGV